MNTKVFKHFIDLDNPDSSSEFKEGLGKDNLVFFAESNSLNHHGFKGPASIKYNINGTTFYEFDKIRLCIQKKFLYLNKDHFYTCESNEKIKSLVIFLSDNFFSGILESMLFTDEKLLDSYGPCFLQPLNLFEGLYCVQPSMDLVFKKLIKALSRKSSIFEVELLLYDIGEIFVREQLSKIPAIQKQEAKKISTRVELYRRISLCKDFIECNYDKRISLAHLANISQMAPHHFLRVFKTLCNKSPYQVLIDTRMKKAKELLRYSNLSIIDISLSTGMTDLSSLSRLFYKQFKISPTNYRKNFTKVI